jgi:ABC-type multidrug transport system fused ATPase/permease subunit
VIQIGIPVVISLGIFLIYQYRYHRYDHYYQRTKHYLPLPTQDVEEVDSDVEPDAERENPFTSLLYQSPEEKIAGVELGSGFVVPEHGLMTLSQINSKVSWLRLGFIVSLWGLIGLWAYEMIVAANAFIAIPLALRIVLNLGLVWSGMTMPSSRYFNLVFIYFIQTGCEILLFRSKFLGVEVIQWHHGISIAQGVLMVLVFVFVTLEYNRITVKKQTMLLATDTTSGLTLSLEPFASLIQLVTFSWFTPMIHIGYKKTLEMKDLWDLVLQDKSAASVRTYVVYAKPGRPFIVSLILTLKNLVLYQVFVALAAALLVFAGPFFLNRLLSYLESTDGTVRTSWEPYFYVLGLFVCSSLSSLLYGQTYFTGRRVGTRLRAILNSLLYRKTLTRNPHIIPTPSMQHVQDDAEDEAAEGANKTEENGKTETEVATPNVVNQDINVLIGTDTQRLLDYLSYVHFILTTPVQIILAITALYHVLGWSALMGVVLMAIMMPIQSFLSKILQYQQEKVMTATDARVNKMEEVLVGMRIIKYFAWEDSFAQVIRQLRNIEMRHLLQYWKSMCGVNVMYHAVPTLVSLSTFITYTKIAGESLDATKVFTCISLFNTLRMPLWDLPDQIIRFMEVRVSIRRIQMYLDAVDINDYTIDTSREATHDKALGDSLPTKDHKEESIYMGCASATLQWPTLSNVRDPTGLIPPSEELDNGQPSAFTLKNLNLNFPKGKLSIVLGPTGSGKTSLLHTLLGELTLQHGAVYMPHVPIAYVPQQAWLLNATVKENILFGSDEDLTRYNTVIRDCALRRDLQILEAGDQTQVGEKGIALSGGQKSRVSLARACYTKCDIVLMDDVLSAVDAPTASHLFSKCILKQLENRTRVLVTHNVGLVANHADYIVYVKDGRILAAANSIGEAASQLSASGYEEEATMLNEVARPISVSRPASMRSGKRLVMGQGAGSSEATMVQGEDPDSEAENELINAQNEKEHQLIKEEDKSEGSVDWRVYSSYIVATGGLFWWVILIGGLVTPQGLNVIQDWWLKTWAQAYTNSGVYVMYSLPTGVRVAVVDVNYYMIIYMALCIVNIVVQYVFNLVEVYRSLYASSHMHDDLLIRVLGAPMGFFDSTPVGRIVNRFSKDVQTIDREVLGSMMGTAWTLISVILILTMVSIISPLFIVFLGPVIFMYCVISKYYLATSRELKRLESVTRSPIFSVFQETHTGTSVIRAFKREGDFLLRAHDRMDTHQRAFFWLWVSNRWLSIRVDFLSNVIVMACGLAILVTGKLYAGTAGMAMSWVMTVSESCLWLVRLHAIMEMNLNSVERFEEYMKVEQEPRDGSRPAVEEWPTEGAIVVDDLSLQYPTSTSPVLHHVSFKVNPCEKVGIVGRTGAGKSSLTLGLLRMMEALTGEIRVDGVRIADLDLKVLRSRLSLVPQDPVLFEGTLRSNLDVLNEFDDATCWNALKRVHFFESTQCEEAEVDDSAVQSTCSLDGDDRTLAGETAPQGTSSWTLDSHIAQNGKNLSVGQRQLLALARALVRRSKVVIMDESTANVSHELDAKIQTTIQEEFTSSTILCIAHRLRTVINFDKILVLDAGEVVEFGSPADLIRIQDGVFRHMCLESGEFDYLYHMATGEQAPMLATDSEFEES